MVPCIKPQDVKLTLMFLRFLFDKNMHVQLVIYSSIYALGSPEGLPVSCYHDKRTQTSSSKEKNKRPLSIWSEPLEPFLRPATFDAVSWR